MTPHIHNRALSSCWRSSNTTSLPFPLSTCMALNNFIQKRQLMQNSSKISYIFNRPCSVSYLKFSKQSKKQLKTTFYAKKRAILCNLLVVIEANQIELRRSGYHVFWGNQASFPCLKTFKTRKLTKKASSTRCWMLQVLQLIRLQVSQLVWKPSPASLSVVTSKILKLCMLLHQESWP